MLFPLLISERHRAGIYRIVCYATGDAYIGSTGDLWLRFCSHRSNSNDTYNRSRLYTRIREIGIENFCFEVICFCDGEDTEFMLIGEHKMMRMFSPSLNSQTGYPKPVSLRTGVFHIDSPNCQTYLPIVDRRKLKSLLNNGKGIKEMSSESGISAQLIKNFRDKSTGTALNVYRFATYLRSIPKQSHCVNNLAVSI